MSITADEIASQPEVWRRAIAQAPEAAPVLSAPGEKVLVIGCGTSAYVAESIAALREAAGLGVTDAAYASEPRVWRDWDRVVAISRSGTTTEVIAALDDVPSGVPVVVVTGVVDSPLARRADHVVLLDWADERSVVQTRFPTTFLVMIRAAFGEKLDALPGELQAALEEELPVDPAAIDHVVYLGTGWTHGLAQEAALKIRESAQAWSESYPLLDYRHGPLAVAHPTSLVWMIGARDDALASDIAVTGATVVQGVGDPLVDLVRAQRFAVAAAEHKGLDPDAPRHLTRSIVLG